MKKKVFYLIAFIVFLMFCFYFVMHFKVFNHLIGNPIVNSIEINQSEPILGVFSFSPGAKNQIIDSIPHFTVKLRNDDDWDLKKNEIAGINDSIALIITVETFGGNIVSSYLNNPLEDMINGKFDHVIKQMCIQLIGPRPNVYFRFNPEMEVPVNTHPWQYLGGSAYIKAFRHFSSLCKTFAPQVKQIWGPAGYPGTMEFYPGDDVVDAVSVTLKSDSEIPLDAYPKNHPVDYDLFRRIHRLRFTDKPVFILGSPNNANDSVDQQLITNLTQLISKERDVVYSEENYRRPQLKEKNDWTEGFEIGFYDPQSRLIDDQAVTVEHLFADFGNLHDGTFKKSFNDAVKREHNVIVTFEPFRNPDGKTDLQVLQHVTEGMYDREIRHLYSIIRSTGRKIYLRYAHEMEIPISRYPWQSQNPITYIKSFRYFMNFMDTLPQNINRVWGPAGDRGSLEWWPGNDVVDFISIAIYGLPDKNITDPEKQESFETIFNRKYWRMRFVDKPLFITEFGAKGSEDYQTKWLEESAKLIRKNPQIKGINYFNMSDTPLAWGEIKPPDWSITKKSFHHFVETLNEE